MPTDDTEVRPNHLDRLVARCRAAAEEALADETAVAGRPVRPGDVYVLPETAGFPVEWALLERHLESLDRFWAVPADTQPLAGPWDIEIPAGSPGGFLVLRTALGAWLPEAALPPERRTRSLPAASLAEAKRALSESREWLRGEGAGEEAASSSEVADWYREVLRPACAAATAAGRPEPAPGVTRPARPWWTSRAAAVIAAASVAVVAAGWMGQSLGRQWGEERARSLTDMIDRQAGENEALRSRLESERQAHREKLRELESRLGGEPGRAEVWVNPPRVSLRPAVRVRSVPSVLRSPAAGTGSSVELVLPVGTRFPGYRLTVMRGEEKLRQRHFVDLAEPTLQVFLSRLEAGSYRLLLDGLRNGRATRVAEYHLEIAR